MDLMLKITEEVQEQWSKLQQTEEGNGDGLPFRSVYTLNGSSILPPLMTPERRLEMRELREAAMEIEQQLGDELKIAYKKKNRKLKVNSDCGKLVDASTSTDAQQPPQPLTVMGHFKQQLQLSETLIYDNNLNAIIKFVKSDQMESKVMQLVLEEWPGLRVQSAVIKEQCPKFAMLSVPELSDLELDRGTSPEAPAPTETTEASSESPIEGHKAIKDLLGVAKQLKENIVSTEHELRRCSTSPLLVSKAEKDLPLKDIVSSYSYLDRRERLHPTLWKRYHSYPFGSTCKPSDCAAPTSPNAADMAIPQPIVPLPETPVAVTSSKIQVKQRMVSEDPASGAETKLKSKALNGSLQKLMGNKLASNKKTPRATNSVSYAAHATSHAKVEGGNNEGNTKISSTQRRLSYDPRATLKRGTVLKKTATNTNPSQAIVQTVPPSVGNTDPQKRKLLDEMEQQQRQRFHQLVSQQADEQLRMQDEFRSQQQLLMDQMVSDMSTFPYEKFEEPDHADSETSSITSLSQSRHELDNNEEQKSGI